MEKIRVYVEDKINDNDEDEDRRILKKKQKKKYNVKQEWVRFIIDSVNN